MILEYLLRSAGSLPSTLPSVLIRKPDPALNIASSYNSVHSATLGKGQSDDTLIKIQKGDMDAKGEVTLVFGKQVRVFPQCLIGWPG